MSAFPYLSNGDLDRLQVGFFKKPTYFLTSESELQELFCTPVTCLNSNNIQFRRFCDRLLSEINFQGQFFTSNEALLVQLSSKLGIPKEFHQANHLILCLIAICILNLAEQHKAQNNQACR